VTFQQLPDVNRKNLFLTLSRLPGNKGGQAELYFNLNDRQRKWECLTYFPQPTEDFLLYLGLAGSVEYPGLMVARQTFDTSQPDTKVRISAAKLIGLVVGKSGAIQSANATSRDWERLEMIVRAAFMTACNSGPLSGSSETTH
jgi:hypothetical protein